MATVAAEQGVHKIKHQSATTRITISHTFADPAGPDRRLQAMVRVMSDGHIVMATFGSMHLD